MTQEEIRKLLSGYATNALTERGLVDQCNTLGVLAPLVANIDADVIALRQFPAERAAPA